MGKFQKEKEQWLIISYFGADALELQQILKHGKLWDGDRLIVKKTQHEHIDHGKKLSMRSLCEQCGKKCGDLITDNVVVQCGVGCKFLQQ